MAVGNTCARGKEKEKWPHGASYSGEGRGGEGLEEELEPGVSCAVQ
jgi:hypothetical protein